MKNGRVAGCLGVLKVLTASVPAQTSGARPYTAVLKPDFVTASEATFL